MSPKPKGVFPKLPSLAQIEDLLRAHAEATPGFWLGRHHGSPREELLYTGKNEFIARFEASDAGASNRTLVELMHSEWPALCAIAANHVRWLTEDGPTVPFEFHDARVAELIEANNREVERRRVAERDLAELRRDPRADLLKAGHLEPAWLKSELFLRIEQEAHRQDISVMEIIEAAFDGYVASIATAEKDLHATLATMPLTSQEYECLIEDSNFLKLCTYDGLNNTPAVALAVAGHHELLQRGLAAPQLILHWEQQAIVAFAGEEPIGVIVWSKNAYAKQAWVVLSYVVPRWREKGVWPLMWEKLVELAREAKLVTIESATHPDNKAMRAAAEAVGRTERGIILSYAIPDATGASEEACTAAR